MEYAYLPGTVRERIQDLIKERKITQAELADQIGMSDGALSRFLSGKTDKIGDDAIIKVANFLGVSTDFILGQTDFPERRNYDIGELGLSYKAAMALYTREVDSDVVNRILESPQFPEITRMIARYFDNTFADGFAARNALMDTLRQYISTADTSGLSNPQKGAEAAAQLIDAQIIQPDELDVSMIQKALMDMLREIKAGIRAQTSTTELATKQITEAMMQSMAKGENSVPSVPGASPEQLAGVYSALTGASPELGQQFSGLIQNFVTGFMDIAEKQGLTNGDTNGTSDQ